MKIKVENSDVRDFYQLKVGDKITNARYVYTDNIKMDEYLATEFGRDVPCHIVIAEPNSEEDTGKAIQIWIDGEWRVWTSPVKSIRRNKDELIIITASGRTYQFCLY